MRTPKRIYLTISRKLQRKVRDSDLCVDYQQALAEVRARNDELWEGAGDWRVVPFNVDSSPRV